MARKAKQNEKVRRRGKVKVRQREREIGRVRETAELSNVEVISRI